MLKFTDEQKARHSLIDGPVWNNGCEHPKESYICSFAIPSISQGKCVSDRYDIYLFPDKSASTSVCLRFGNEAHEYISPGGLLDFLFSTGCNWRELQHYHRAASIIREFVKVKATVRQS